MSIARPAGHSSLEPAQLASAATMASVCVGLVVVGTVVPHLGPLQLVAVVPFGIVAHRHGVRALLATFVAAALTAALVTGFGTAVNLAVCAGLGGLVGDLKRRGRGVGAVCLAAAVLSPLAAAGVDLLLLVFASYRTLVFTTLRSTVRGLASTLHRLGLAPSIGPALERATGTVTGHWAVSVAIVILIVTPVALLSSWVLIGEVLDRLQWVRTGDLATLASEPEALAVTPAPVPVTLRGVSVRYDEVQALAEIDLQIPAGQFIAVIGDNGSGKSTLARLLAGAGPSAGEIERGGPVGLGRDGGTALIGQRPDAQVLGLHVADDVVWGLPEDHAVDVEELLAVVGLAGMGARETATLSGGQLQRLAVAAALARRPRLLISDESTAMVDPAGRRELTRVLAELPRRRAMTVVHITHNEEELALADRVVRLAGGRVVADDLSAPAPDPLPVPATEAPELRVVPEPRAAGVGAGRGSTAHLQMQALGHSYAHRTVWQQRALHGVTLSVQAGEGVLVVGENGSGKSTLAWILAGLVRPTDGQCLLQGRPTHRRAGAVALAFQHARLQLQRPTVGEEIADATGWGGAARSASGWSGPAGSASRGTPMLGEELDRRVAAALQAVGLDPELAGRSIEALSGGQQRRVAIAGLLARRPRVLILDEPLAGLDTPSRLALVSLLGELRRREGLTLIVVTHDPESLAAVCPRRVRLEHGRIIEDATALEAPAAGESDAA